jgi:hypothetical protein
MPRKTKRYTFAISTAMIQHQLTGFLDMMRYDSARVISSAPDVTILQTTPLPPTRERWASFRMYVLAEQEGDYPDTDYLKKEARFKLPLPATSRFHTEGV